MISTTYILMDEFYVCKKIEFVVFLFFKNLLIFLQPFHKII